MPDLTRIARRLLAPLAATSVLLIGGCTGFVTVTDPEVSATAGTDGPGGTPTPTASIAFQLYAHCGVREARVDTVYYATKHVLDDGHGNPPQGWSDQQAGTMTLMSDGTAVFTDPQGHLVVFYPRTGATAFATICS